MTTELKEDLKRLNEYYLSFPKSEKENGIHVFANKPPQDGDYLVTKIWDKHMLPSGRDDKESKQNQKMRPFEEIKKIKDGPEIMTQKDEFGPVNVDSVTFQRKVRVKKRLMVSNTKTI